ncbi:hypothetical protein PPL19_19882 [Pseudomonas psychrotolerans L19]|nr:hypothetical protein PPL19_19882 [Pseudomonas psychrotolerans L19]
MEAADDGCGDGWGQLSLDASDAQDAISTDLRTSGSSARDGP